MVAIYPVFFGWNVVQMQEERGLIFITILQIRRIVSLKSVTSKLFSLF